jgi:hypothetical protein
VTAREYFLLHFGIIAVIIIIIIHGCKVNRTMSKYTQQQHQQRLF